MTDTITNLLPEGLADRLPAEAAKVTTAMRAVLEVMDGHGYDRVSPPLMEFEESLAARMSGSGTRASFRFVDPASLRMLALRSDITPQIGRIAATALASQARPLRLCYSGEVAAIHADQLDPARQRIQTGAELIGSDTVAAACEIVTLALEAVRAAGATGVSVDFTLPDLIDVLASSSLPLSGAQMADVRRELDTKDAGGLKQAGGEAYLPLLYATGEFDDALAKLAAFDAGGDLASRIDGLQRIADRVGGDARVTLDPTERHGFEYQSWFGFTIYADGVRGALGRGGTYSIPTGEGRAETATGFSLFMDGLVYASQPDTARDTVFVPIDHDRAAAARFRAIGWRTVAALTAQDDARTLGATHRLDGQDVIAL